MLPPMLVTQKALRPDVATCPMPKPPLGPSSQPRIVRLPNVQRPRDAVSQSRTCPQSRFDPSDGAHDQRLVTESAVTGAAFVTVRPGVSSASGGRRSDERRRGSGRRGGGACDGSSSRRVTADEESVRRVCGSRAAAAGRRYPLVHAQLELRPLREGPPDRRGTPAQAPLRAGRVHHVARARLRAAHGRRAPREDRRVQAADRERRVARRDPLRGVRRRPRGAQARVRAAPVRRPADGRHRPPRGRHRGDEDR